ncbi:hypothetical protein E2C01_048190 [Portunus trituberculatus]|uniref:Uncharacterized protein n=1 Tax=Portunus trituberculatus TaxID=210409 RepID=A0A5B7G314_PORTR|nr:hypothetical protein [Portunus trituberculatus]
MKCRLAKARLSQHARHRFPGRGCGGSITQHHNRREASVNLHGGARRGKAGRGGARRDGRADAWQAARHLSRVGLDGAPWGRCSHGRAAPLRPALPFPLWPALAAPLR